MRNTSKVTFENSWVVAWCEMCASQQLLLWWYPGNLRTLLCLIGEPVFPDLLFSETLGVSKSQSPKPPEGADWKLIFSTVLLSCSSKYSSPDVTVSVQPTATTWREEGWGGWAWLHVFHSSEDTSFEGWRLHPPTPNPWPSTLPPFLGQWGWRHLIAGGTTPEAQSAEDQGGVHHWQTVQCFHSASIPWLTPARSFYPLNKEERRHLLLFHLNHMLIT